MIERLLVPIDGGAFGERAFAPSIALAQQLRATLVGFIVEPFSPESGADANSAATPDTSLQAHASDVLAHFEQQARDAGVPFVGVATQSADVSAAILHAAEEQHCDMIVMLTHGRGVVAELLWGSNTRQVMSRSRLPVLVLH